MNKYFRLLLVGCSCLALTGCLGILRPAKPTARYFVLTPIHESRSGQTAGGDLGVGVAQVQIPAYLMNTSLAMRRGPNEVEFLPGAVWAERLDRGLQRVLAANLAAALPSNRVQLSAWEREEVAVEIHLAVERFEVDVDGRARLVARWRLTRPGGESVVESGQSQRETDGPSPDRDPAGAIGTLSALAGDLSLQLARAIEEAKL